MATGTVSVHSFSDGMDDDEGFPSMSSNYNARLDLSEEFNASASAARMTRGMATRSTVSGSLGGRVLRSRVVPAAQEANDDGDDTHSSDDAEGELRVPGAW